MVIRAKKEYYSMIDLRAQKRDSIGLVLNLWAYHCSAADQVLEVPKSTQRSWRLKPVVPTRMRGCNYCCQELEGSPFTLLSALQFSFYYLHCQSLTGRAGRRVNEIQLCSLSRSTKEQNLEWWFWSWETMCKWST